MLVIQAMGGGNQADQQIVNHISFGVGEIEIHKWPGCG
jgi:hypothetical protein